MINHALKTRRNHSGFSLIEIMIVVSIIAVMVTILVTGGIIWTEKAKISQTENKINLLSTITGAYYAKMERYFNGSIKTMGAFINRLNHVDDTSEMIGGILSSAGTVEWSTGVDYTTVTSENPGSIVFLNDQTYQCIKSHSSSASNEPGKDSNPSWTTYWQYEPVLDAWYNPIRIFNPNPDSSSDQDPLKPYFWSYGPDGVNGTGIPLNYSSSDFPVHWNNATSYSSGDIVLYNGNFYTCVKNHTSDENKTTQQTEFWLKADDIGTFK